MVKKKRVDPYFILLKPAPIVGSNGETAGYSQPVVFSLSLFHRTMRRWIFDSKTMEHVYTQFTSFKVTHRNPELPDELPETGIQCFSIDRALAPKRSGADPVSEHIDVHVNWDSKSASYTFASQQPPPISYFQVHSFTITYEPQESPHADALNIASASLANPAPAIPMDFQLSPVATVSVRWTPPLDDVSVFEDLLARAFKWTTHDLLGGYIPVAKDVLVSKDQFKSMYKSLKRKYAYLLTSWTECTDPTKYVYEDLALTAYITLLWAHVHGETHARDNVVFADLGCGNGLLTFLLSMEGFSGYGIDSRARKIWPRWREECPSIQLTESMLDLHTFALPSDVTWVIGNHADELCPWIPELSLRPRLEPVSRTDTSLVGTSVAPYLMILPCCYYNRDGVLFCPPKSSFPVPPHLELAGSRYKRYLQYVGEQCATNGFHVTYDALRIPSTKNQALICRHSSVSPKGLHG